jgi:hypothetical protein
MIRRPTVAPDLLMTPCLPPSSKLPTMSSPAGDSTDVPTTSTPTDPSFPIPSVAGAVAQEQQHDDRREPADDASAGREYKRARGDLALGPSSSSSLRDASWPR